MSIPQNEDQNPAQSLVTLDLLYKTAGEGEDDPWTFAGIASDESKDADGDTILKKSLDLTYAKARGYVNWNHSTEPEAQIGFLTKVDLVDQTLIKNLAKTFNVDLSKTASLYVEGELYKHVPKAAAVRDVLKSTPGGRGSLGLSLDGLMAKNVKTKEVLKAYVRGVAFTPYPAHPNTLTALLKSLQSCSSGEIEIQMGKPEGLRTDEAKEVTEVLRKSAFLTEEDAAVWLLKRKPHWTYEFATKVVRYTIQNSVNPRED